MKSRSILSHSFGRKEIATIHQHEVWTDGWVILLDDRSKTVAEEVHRRPMKVSVRTNVYLSLSFKKNLRSNQLYSIILFCELYLYVCWYDVYLFFGGGGNAFLYYHTNAIHRSLIVVGFKHCFGWYDHSLLLVSMLFGHPLHSIMSISFVSFPATYLFFAIHPLIG
jgi:hypothetical protein